MRRHLARAVLVIAGVGPAGLAAQRPTPVDRREVIVRLPKPENVTLRQNARGEVELTWSPVPGAKTYLLGRSIGTNGYQRVTQPLTGPTQFIDAEARVGTRISYFITPVDSAGLAGFRVVTPDFTPVAMQPQVPATRPVAAALEGRDLVVRWTAVPGTDYYVVSHFVSGRGVAAPVRVGLSHEFRVAAPAPGEHVFFIESHGMLGGSSRPSNPVVVQPPPVAADSGAGLGPSPSPSGGSPPAGGGPAIAAPTPAPIAPSEVALVVAAPVALRVGATASLSAPAGARWSSLDPSVVTVDAAGTVSAAAAGRARIVALSPQGDGSLRITVVHVVVTP